MFGAVSTELNFPHLLITSGISQQNTMRLSGRGTRNNRITWHEIFSTMQAKEAQGLSLWPFQRGEIKCFAVLGIMEGREGGGGVSAMDELALEVERGSREKFMMENKNGR